MASASTVTDTQECEYKYQLSRLPKGWLDGLGNEEDNVNDNTSTSVQGVGEPIIYAENTQNDWRHCAVGFGSTVDLRSLISSLPTYKELFDGVVNQLSSLVSSWNSETDFGTDCDGSVDGELSLFGSSIYPIGYEQQQQLEDVQSPMTIGSAESRSNSQNSSMNTSFGPEYECDQQQQQYIYDYNYNQNQQQQQGELMQVQGQGYDNYGGDVGYSAQQAQQQDQWQQCYDYNGNGYPHYYNNYNNNYNYQQHQPMGMGRGYGYGGNANGHGSSSGSNRGREPQEFVVKYRRRSHKIPRPPQSQK